MAFRSNSPTSSRILSVTDTNTSGSNPYLFTVPQDADCVVAKFWTGAQFPGALAGSVDVYVQTSEDGGTSWRDVAYWNTTSTIGVVNAHFQPLPIVGSNLRGVANWVGSVTSASLITASVASKAVGTTSGLPLMGTIGRVLVNYNGTVASNLGINIDLFATTTNRVA